MALIEFIEHLQQKPEATRRRILALSVAGFMGVIILIWIMTLRFTLNTKLGDMAAQPSQADVSPFTLLGQSLRQGLEETAKQIFNK